MLINGRKLCLHFSVKQADIEPLLEDFRIKLSVGEEIRPSNTYRLDKARRGLVGVFNYMKFDDKTLKHRSGASRDSENLKSVFKQMNYLVEVYHDLTETDTLSKLDEITQRVNIDSLILFFLSHGKTVNNFHAKDKGSSVNVYDIMYRFTNTKCPSLKGKPKILLFNYCRGDTLQSTVVRGGGPIIVREVPKDMELVHATLPGIMAIRTSTGTIFVNSLCKVLCESAQTKDLHDIVTETSLLMQKSNGTTASHTSIDMMKKFYFM